jgi:TRAP transporter 4TM/12TM fusion protein
MMNKRTILITILGSSIAIYHLLQAFVLTQSSIILFLVHASAALVLINLRDILRLFGNRRVSSYQLVLRSFIFILGVGGLVYMWSQSSRLEVNWPMISNTDVGVGFLLFFAITATTWFVWGSVLSIVGVVGILYFLFGNHLPGLLGHSGVSVHYAMSYLGLSLQTGMFWLLRLSATVIFPLMVFASLLEATHATDVFAEFMKVARRRSKIAPVYTCVMGSALFGMVTGDPATNVIVTGSSTIPGMKKIGLRPETAGAFEAVSSTGTQIVPPMMGLAAFLMAELIGMPYRDIMLAAVIPALLYYISLLLSGYFLAHNELDTRSVKIENQSKEQVEWDKLFRLLPTFVVPLSIVIVLIIIGFSPLYSSGYGVIALLVLSQMQGKLRPSLVDLANGLSEGAIRGSQVAVILMNVGFLGQAIISTGLGGRLGKFLMMLVGESFVMSVLVVMFLAIILGMGAPTIVAYILSGIAVVPPMIDLGADKLVAHFFAFYFALFSHFTPPVAPAVNVASRIAEAKFFPTAWCSIKIALPIFLMPLFIVFHPEIIRFKISVETIIALSVYLLIIICSIAAAWNGLPELRIGVIGRWFLVAGCIAGIGYIFYEDHYCLIAVLLASFLGWGICLLQKMRQRKVREEKQIGIE